MEGGEAGALARVRNGARRGGVLARGDTPQEENHQRRLLRNFFQKELRPFSAPGVTWLDVGHSPRSSEALTSGWIMGDCAGDTSGAFSDAIICAVWMADLRVSRVLSWGCCCGDETAAVVGAGVDSLRSESWTLEEGRGEAAELTLPSLVLTTGGGVFLPTSCFFSPCFGFVESRRACSALAGRDDLGLCTPKRSERDARGGGIDGVRNNFVLCSGDDTSKNIN